MTEPRKAPRGRGSASEVVEIYRILHAAGEPLTVRQIVAQLSRVGWPSAAMRAYRKHLEMSIPKHARLDLPPDPWPPELVDEALEWWVAETIRANMRASGGMYKNFVHADEVRRTGVRYAGRYAPGRPPTVIRPVWTEGTTTVAWTPELEAETTGAHVAGMQFLSELRQYRERGKHSAEETRALLALAERAIKRNPDPAPD